MPDWPGNGSLEWSKLKVLRKVGGGGGGREQALEEPLVRVRGESFNFQLPMGGKAFCFVI